MQPINQLQNCLNILEATAKQASQQNMPDNPDDRFINNLRHNLPLVKPKLIRQIGYIKEKTLNDIRTAQIRGCKNQ